MYKKVLLAIGFLAVTMSISAQKFTGNISPLKGQKEVNVVIDFSEMLVNKQPEESHIAFNTKDKSEEEKEQWLKEWNEKMREEAFEQLKEELNKAVTKKGFLVGNYPNVEYTILVKVNSLSPGVHKLISSNVSSTVYFVKTGQTTPFATLEYKRIWGKWSDLLPDHVARIGKAFGYLGSNLGKTISKKIK